MVPMIEAKEVGIQKKSLRADLRPRAWLAFWIVLSLVVLGAGYAGRSRREPQASTEIFKGVMYGCDRLDRTEEGSGLVHWVQIDLAAPGIELYVTPLDRSAVATGWQYRLRRVEDVVRSEQLAVAVNGSYFSSKFDWLLRVPGDFAKGLDTVVSDHVVSHIWERTYLLWFSDQLTPSLSISKPPSAAELGLAKWGIGTIEVGLHDGKVWPGNGRAPDSRTAVAIDRPRKLLFLAVGEYISPRLLLQKLAGLGAKDGMLLDGGGSTSMAIGQGAVGLAPGVLYGGWRPVATHFGVRAQPKF